MKVIEKVNKIVGKGVSFLIVLIASVIGIEVIARYLFNRPTIWAQEFSTMLFGAYIILGGAYTALHKGHVNMDVIYGRLSPLTKTILEIIGFLLLSGPFLFVLFWKGGEMAMRSLIRLEHSSSVWSPPLYPLKMTLPIGAFLFLLQILLNLFYETTQIKKRKM